MPLAIGLLTVGLVLVTAAVKDLTIAEVFAGSFGKPLRRNISDDAVASEPTSAGVGDVKDSLLGAASPVVGSKMTYYSDAAKRYGLKVTSTTGGTHAPGSWHYKGQALDASGKPSDQKAFAKAMAARATDLEELIYISGPCADNGRVVSCAFYAASLPGHADHVHIAWKK